MPGISSTRRWRTRCFSAANSPTTACRSSGLHRPTPTSIWVSKPAAAGFDTQIEVGVGRCNPLDLQAVVGELAAEKHLVRQRRVDEIPGMRVNFVQIADARIEPPRLEREALGQA